MRHHTHCEIPEYYEAADEVGIMVQPELPYYGGFGPDRPYSHLSGAPLMAKDDLAELVTHYRRYTSLATYCGGNEGVCPSPLGQGTLPAGQAARSVAALGVHGRRRQHAGELRREQLLGRRPAHPSGDEGERLAARAPRIHEPGAQRGPAAGAEVHRRLRCRTSRWRRCKRS